MAVLIIDVLKDLLRSPKMAVLDNKNLTDSVTIAMDEVANIANDGMNKVIEVSTVMDEIYNGAEMYHKPLWAYQKHK